MRTTEIASSTHILNPPVKSLRVYDSFHWLNLVKDPNQESKQPERQCNEPQGDKIPQVSLLPTRK